MTKKSMCITAAGVIGALSLAACGAETTPKSKLRNDPSNTSNNNNNNGTPYTCEGTTTTDGVAAHAGCETMLTALCTRALNECSADFSELVGAYSSLDECLAGECVDAQEWQGLSAVNANINTCVSWINASTCGDVADGVGTPEECNSWAEEVIATPPVTSCTTITPGTTEGSLEASDPSFDWGPGVVFYDTYCFSLEAGQTATVSTSAGIGAATDDTVLQVVDSTCDMLAYNDDIAAENYYSMLQFTATTAGNYSLLVHGFDESSAGSYDLLLTVE